MKATNDNEKILLTLFQDILESKNIGINDNFFNCGGDSLSMLQCIARSNQLGFDLCYEIFLINPTVSYLANFKLQKHTNADNPESLENIPLIALQKRFFLKERHWTEAKLIPRYTSLNRNIDIDLFKDACKKLFLYHDALNLRFYRDKNGWMQRLLPSEENFYFEFLDLTQAPKENIESIYNSYITKQSSNFDLENGYLIKFLLIDVDQERPYHFIIASHHLCMDGVSHQIVLQDIFETYRNIYKKNNGFELYQTTSFEKWASFLLRYANSNEVKKDLIFWRKIEAIQSSNIPIDYPDTGQKNLASDIEEYEVEIYPALSSMIYKQIPKSKSNISVLDVLLSGFLFTLNEFTASTYHLVDIRRHGRDFFADNINLTKTVGWLTVVYPVLFHSNDTLATKEALHEIHRQLFGVPKNGLTYGLLRYLVDDESIKTAMNNLPRAQVAFNYHGVIDSIFSNNDLFSFLKKTTGNNTGTNATRSHLLNIDIMICNERIHVIWTYSKKFHNQLTITKLQEKYTKALEKIMYALLSDSVN